MNIRELLEEREYSVLDEKAAKSRESKGRNIQEEQCGFRTDFQRDRDRIIHSKSFRRLMHKTQVFLAPEGDHFRTRLTHTLEVSQIARTVARALRLNEDLTEAIAMGHDLGHTPFGHNGEDFLDQKHPGGFKHNEQSLRIVDYLERNEQGRSMNLTAEVRDGILNHTGPVMPFTLEGQIVKVSDRIAYINHDIDDAIRGGIICPEDLPEECIRGLGGDHKKRIDTLVRDLVENSVGKDAVSLSEEGMALMNSLRSFMFQNVYHSKIVKQDEELDKVRHLIFSLYGYFRENPDKLPKERLDMVDEFGLDEIVKDHIAGMTDRYAINIYKKVFVPRGWQ